jgi:hypothetical protein
VPYTISERLILSGILNLCRPEWPVRKAEEQENPIEKVGIKSCKY